MKAEPATPFDNELFSRAYEELRRLARGIAGEHGGLTWNATAIVKEVYVQTSAPG